MLRYLKEKAISGLIPKNRGIDLTRLLTLGSILGLSCLWSLVSLADENNNPILGYWKSHQFHLTSEFGQGCPSIYDAADSILPSVEAKSINVVCTSYHGADLSFSSLVATPPSPHDQPVQAFWQSIRLTLFRDSSRCTETAERIDWLLDQLTIRNIQSYVFCDSGGGSLSYQFEALVPYSPLPPAEIGSTTRPEKDSDSGAPNCNTTPKTGARIP